MYHLTSEFNHKNDIFREKEEIKQELKQELMWVKYRQRMLDIIEEKLFQMKQLAEKAKEKSLSADESKELNDRLNNLAEQVKALDEESRRIEDIRILE
ncbi:hypothetical protein KYD98_15860 [Clostridium sp. YB-6]|uniref:Uncharacterized protein n=2 Tax=Clostridium weizhouense TaxID=2859781 RepID=A0ABS7ASD4_9CLOT|nr:hypothetical protein [Clostridium weizhouense]